MFKKAYTYVEVIVALAVLLIAIIPAIKANNFQLISYNKMENLEEDIEFFNFIETTFHAINFEKLENKIGNYNVKNFEDFKNLDIFSERINMDEKKFKSREYSMNIDIDKTYIDYVNRKENGIFIILNIHSKETKTTRKILRIK